VSVIHKLITSIWNKEEMPDQWNESIILPIHKTGDKTDCNNYRGISLLSTSYKILSIIRLSRLSPYIDEIIGDHHCAIRNIQENQAGLKLNWTHQILAYADDVNLLGHNIDTINKNKQTLIDASKEVGLEVNVEKTKYMLVSQEENAGQNREIKIGNRSFKNVSQFKYFGTTVPNQNFIQEEIKRRLYSGNACYHSVQNLLSSRLQSKNVKVRIYKTIIFACGTIWV
jgi:hypothetical protein